MSGFGLALSIKVRMENLVEPSTLCVLKGKDRRESSKVKGKRNKE